ncbi:hypothetical protein JCM8097_006075 [Rhodosporidiobolus ruineniae]
MGDSPTPSSSSPPPSTSQPAPSSTPATASTAPKVDSAPASPSAAPAGKRKHSNIVVIDSDSDSDGDDTKMDVDEDYEDKGAKKSSKKGKEDAADKKKKPVAPKSKASKPAAKEAADKGSKKEDKLVDFNLKMCKIDFRQKAFKADMAPSYLRDLTAFTEYATKRLQDDKDAVLDDWSEKHSGLIAKLAHESTAALGTLANQIKKQLGAAVEGNLLAAEDSQTDEATEPGGVEKRIPVAPLKAFISTLATRTNYGLSLPLLQSPSSASSSSSPDSPSSSDTPEEKKDEAKEDETEKFELPEGVKDVPEKLQIWVWEVKDLSLLASEYSGKWEKRRAEREQIQQDALALFRSFTPSERSNLLTGTKSASATSSTAAAARKADKGKMKAIKPEESDAEDADAEGEKKEKEKPKKVKKEKELTEEQKKEQEEKARKKAEKAAEAEAKKKEREEKKAERDAVKAEKDKIKAEKDKVKREKEEEEERKVQAKKKQSSMFTNFFMKTSPVPDAGPSGTKSATATPNKDVKDSPAAPSKKPSKGFDSVFFPFHVKPNVELARTWRPSNEAKEVEIKEEGTLDKSALLSQATSTRPGRSRLVLSAYPSAPVVVRDAVSSINDASLTSNDASWHYEALNDRSRVPVKFLKFREDHRPGYVGTWTKTSRVVGFRTPFARETALLNYDYDSEAEWASEPEGEGEDVGSGNDSDDDGGNVSEADSWLAEDDEIEYEEGYEAEGDVVMLDAEGRGAGGADSDDDIVIVGEEDKKRAKKRKAEKEKGGKGDREGKKRRLKVPLPAVVKGLSWEDEEGQPTEPVFRSMKVQFLNDASFGLNPFTFTSKPFTSSSSANTSASSTAKPSTSKGKGKENVALAPSAASSSSSTSDPSKPLASSSTIPAVPPGTVNTLKPRKAPAKPFPASELAALVAYVHGSSDPKPVLVDGFVKRCKERGVVVTKTAIEAKLKELEVKKVKGKMVLSDEVLTQHGISAAA